MRTFRAVGLVVATLAATVALAGCSTDATMSDPPVADESVPDINVDTAIGGPELATPGDYREFFRGTVEVDDQRSGGATVTVRRAGVDDMVAWVAIRHTDGPDRGEIIGAAPTPVAGALENIEVELNPDLPPGRHDLEAVLYQDASPVGYFNPEAQDNPIANRAGDLVSERFQVTVPG